VLHQSIGGGKASDPGPDDQNVHHSAIHQEADVVQSVDG
jgi:hypothetical protein